MSDVFAKYLRSHIEITDEDLELIRSAGVERNLRKWQPLLQDGETWLINCFITSGCLRIYRFGDDGREHTFRFGVDTWWVTDVESYNREKPSLFNIEALAASTVLIWTKAKWTELMLTIPVLKEFQETLMANSYEASQRRIYSLISSSAEEKYIEFQKTYPSVFNRVPLHMVASYLGVSRETVSRLRKSFTTHR
ncbi:cAMP-binding domain of CRP or a regulatory subunit of cAMP-dependent protein kinases [Mucilaginibacter mallensis]|uniref:cAMP-binding domain of CRP or a regulatory subunit of cAMP-dependent protein kinases n=1 Tax=Mucilaginibacter mallensis TaxID=652787 RepID=A0A1H1SRN5_MUCMA|nr:Crp/Fnr family transcriptional regulator [Mucilaginibacter mallensis]SDS50585.1 cAMP-binding domain of CRP or a regulatory subunit of cAMP-dependent protein kinases [Mucilaginibacter mallensis]